MKKLLVCMVMMLALTGCSGGQQGEVVDVSPFLYKVSDSDGKYMYLLGTCHPGRQAISELDATTMDAFYNSDVLALETSLVVNPLEDYIGYVTDYSVTELGYKEDVIALREVYPEFKDIQGVDIYSYNAMMISSMSNNVMMSEYDGDANTSIDAFLFRAKSSTKIEFAEVEGAEFQYKLYSDISKECTPLLLESLKDRQANVKASKAILDAYYSQDSKTLNEMYSTSTSGASLSDKFPEQQAIYIDKMITSRNKNMVTKCKEYLQSDKVTFMAVGVGHVLGDDGLVNRLKADGYTVECMAK